MTENSLTQITVPFHSAELYLVEHEGQPYTPMKPIVDGMGLDWAAQFNKLKQKFSSTIAEIAMVANDGKERFMLCLPIRKLAAWLYSVNANKVRPELRDTVIMYQNECDDVLWDYWTKGQAINPRTTKVERTPLHDAHAMLVAKTKHLNSSDAWKIINQRFGTKSINEIPFDQIPVAVEYVHHLIALYSNADKNAQGSLFDKEAYELIRKLTECVIFQNDEIVPVLLAVKMLDIKKFSYYAHMVTKANDAAREVSRLLDFRNINGEPLVDNNCSMIAMSNGLRFPVRSGWFNSLE
ncbi:phage antirepressor N-terminal domain-containing protein [Acinetobacter haemolyticus]|uniref:phage antirepressor N-terminal domain-containing protein n=1 Tax=Acinetobacter haemolyticus TaxID=29430 RepID=UPI000E5861CB|nr:hypothetical protein AhaeAN54_011685 [Acinetobacter haemolyticus]